MSIRHFLLSLSLLCGVTAVADEVTTVSPQREVCFRTNAANDAWNSGYGDGGAGDYGTSSGGYDQLGYGTLMFAIPESPSTGIQATEQQEQQNSPAYDLRGIRIREEKGIVIKNGMKVVR